MVDITMCRNLQCAKKDICYRFNAIPSSFQSYSDFQPVNGECNHLWEFLTDEELSLLDDIHDDRTDEEILELFEEEDFI